MRPPIRLNIQHDHGRLAAPGGGGGGDSWPGSVLALFEGVVSGAADGYGRIAGRPAATLVHLGPGLGNAWANFHNARRARTPIVSLIGDHATYHKRFDPPLESDIAAVARALDSTVRTPRIAEQVSSCAAAAVADAASAPGRISTVIMPADVSWSPTQTMAAPMPPSPASIVPGERIEQIAALAGQGAQTVLLLGAAACREEGLRAASRIAVATGIPVFTETSPARLEHGAGLPGFPRLGFYPEQAVAQLQGASHVLLAGVHEPVVLGFAYLGQPSSPVPADAAMVTLAAPDEDAARALTDLAAILAPGTAARWRPRRVPRCHPGRSPCSPGHRYWERSCRRTPSSSMSRSERGDGIITGTVGRGSQDRAAHLSHGRGHGIGHAGPAIRQRGTQIPPCFPERLFQAARSDYLQDGRRVGGDEIGVRDAFVQEGDTAAGQFPSLVTGPDRQSAVEEQEDLILSLVDMDRNPAAPCGVASHDQHLAAADDRVDQDLQGRAVHPGQLLVLTGGGDIGAQRHGATLPRKRSGLVQVPRAAGCVFLIATSSHRGADAASLDRGPADKG